MQLRLGWMEDCFAVFEGNSFLELSQLDGQPTAAGAAAFSGQTVIGMTGLQSENVRSGEFFLEVSRHTEGMNDTTFPVTKTDEEWRQQLTPQQYAVLRNHATEAPGSCALLREHRAGTFSCAGCGQRLFVADRKFESGTGWPSFFAPVEGSIGTTVDRSYGMTRTEVHCSNCGGHLGHVFPDGPPPTGLRYCINGVALNFEPKA
jgi:peptide-methionine (R)-S-oxide reductase